MKPIVVVAVSAGSEIPELKIASAPVALLERPRLSAHKRRFLCGVPVAENELSQGTGRL